MTIGPDLAGAVTAFNRFGFGARPGDLAAAAAVVHAVATGYRDRSHFDGQDVLESGNPKPGRTESGWLNRTLGALPASASRRPPPYGARRAADRGAGLRRFRHPSERGRGARRARPAHPGARRRLRR